MKQTFTAAGNTLDIDENGNFSRIESHGNIVEAQEDGGFIVTQPNGNKIKIAPDGSTTFMNTPKSIGVRDISKLASYVTSKNTDGSTHHSIKFLNGGYVDAVYASNGSLASFSGKNILTSISKESEMLVDQSDE